MYRHFFELAEYPFQLTADARYFFQGQGHMRARDYLNYILRERDGVALITGEPGIGKTMLLEHALADLDADIVVGRIQQTLLTTTEFLLAICLQLGMKPFQFNKTVLIDEIQRFCQLQHAEGKNVVLVVDEAHNLRIDTLEEIRMLAKLERNGKRLMQIVLVGQPTLRHMLSSMRNNSLSQMVRLTCQIEPLGKSEIANYIEYRLYVASNGVDRGLFPSELVPAIMRYTGGVPRLINLLSDMMMIVACMRKSQVLDRACLNTAIKTLAWPVYQKRIREMPKAVEDNKFVQQRPLPVLEIRQHNQIVARFLLSRERMRIGREEGQDIRLDDRRASRQHAQILYLFGSFFLQDLNSTNGTYVNGQRVGWHAISNKDRIRIGHCLLEFQEGMAEELSEVTGEITQPKLVAVK
ncbi:MAG: AAA family ATPase [Gammaproteobacteria bacterium]|nr:AAA family ATPase [Gammaproteobacteria bacterium]